MLAYINYTKVTIGDFMDNNIYQGIVKELQSAIMSEINRELDLRERDIIWKDVESVDGKQLYLMIAKELDLLPYSGTCYNIRLIDPKSGDNSNCPKERANVYDALLYLPEDINLNTWNITESILYPTVTSICAPDASKENLNNRYELTHDHQEKVTTARQKISKDDPLVVRAIEMTK